MVFKFNNLGLALAMTLTFYGSVVKESELKVIKFFGLISLFVEVTGEKLVRRGAFLSPLTSVGLKKCFGLLLPHNIFIKLFLTSLLLMELH